MKRWYWMSLAAAVLIAAGVTLVALPRTPEWTTSSSQALAEFEAGDDAWSKIYLAEAREHFRRAYELDPAFLVAKLRLAQFVQEQEPELANRLFAELMTADLTDLTPRERFFVEYWRALRNDQSEESARLLDQCVEEHPSDPYIVVMKAGQASQEGSFEEAERLYQRLLRIDPNWVVAYNALGYLKMMQGRFTEAEEYFKSYRFIAPDQANPHDSLGELFITIGRYGDAETTLEKAIEIKPDFWASYIHLSILKVYDGDFEAIPVLLERARSVEMPQEIIFDIECRAHYTELEDRQAWRQILDQRDSDCLKGFKSEFGAVVTHRAACRTGDWELATALEDEAAGILLQVEESGIEDETAFLQAAVFHMQGARLAILGDYDAAEQRFRAADERLGFTMVDRGMYKLYNRMFLVETMLAAGRDAEAHQLLAKVRNINPKIVEQFEGSGFRYLGLGRSESFADEANRTAERQIPRTAL